MEFVEQALTLLIKFLTLPTVTTTDKILVLLISMVATPYLLFMTTKIYKLSKDLPNILPKWHDKKKDNLRNNFPLNILRNKLIQSALEKMVYDASADRAAVLQFHNGGENIKGIPFIKFSVTNEWCPISVPREADNYRDIPLGIFSGLCYHVIKAKRLYFPSIEDLRAVDSGSYAIFKSKNVQSLYVTGIFDLQDSLIGVVILEFFEKTLLDIDELEIFEKTAGVISGLVICKDGENPELCCSIGH
jgi:hypothetical protein